MHAYLYVSEDNNLRNTSAVEFAKSKATSFDLHVYDASEEGGIDLVREAQTKLTMLPVNSEYTMLVIQNAHDLTVPAQNALLKVLEEPPSHSLIVLTSSNQELLVPTVVSRCLVVHLAATPKEQPAYYELVHTLKTLTLAERFKHAETLEPEEWARSVEYVLRYALIHEPTETQRYITQLALQTLQVLAHSGTYVNKKLLNENLVLDPS